MLSFHEEEAEDLARDYRERPQSGEVVMADALHHLAHLVCQTSPSLEVLCGKWKRAQQLFYHSSQHNGVANAKLIEEINIMILLLKFLFFFFFPRQGAHEKA